MMPIARFQLPDGRVARFEVPEGTTPEQATSMMQAHFAPTSEKPAVPVKIGREGFADTLKATLDDAGWVGRNLAGAGSAAVNAWEGIKGLAGKTDPQQVATQKIIADSAPVGNIVGNMALFAPTAFIPGANTVTGAAAIGALGNALTTPGDAMERAKAGAMGGAGGAAGVKIAGILNKATPAAVNPNVRLLSNEGVGLTPGQNAGGALKAFEDKATSIPILGNVINNARRRGIEDFNKAAIGRVTAPMEKAGLPLNVEGIGSQALQDLRQGLGQSYDDVLARSSANALDPQFAQRMDSLRQLVSALPAKEQKAFDAILQREIGDRMAPNGMVNAENLQALKSGLERQAGNFSTSNDAYQRQLGDALKQASAEFRDLVARANPQNASDLKAIDTAYANFKRLQRAASGVGADEGVFTPAQLHNAARAMDRSKDKRAFSEGTALLQDLTSAGKDVMPSKIPDSGTAGRMMGNLFSLGGLTSTAGGLAAAVPAYVAYSRPGSALINGAVNGTVPLRNALQRALSSDPNVLRILGTSGLPQLVGQ